MYHSPLRKDDHPSFNIYNNKRRGTLWFKDFGNIHGNAIDYVMQREMVGFYEALVLINNRLGLGYAYREYDIPDHINKVKPKEFNEVSDISEDGHFEINVLSHKSEFGEFTYTMTDINYWGSMFIYPDRLLRHRLISVNKAFRNSNLIAEYSDPNPVYAYCFKYKGRWYTKLYRPFEQDSWKFYSDLINVSDKILFGYDLLPDKIPLLAFTKSGKDVMVCETCGLYSVGLQAEDTFPHKDLLIELYDRSEYFLIFFDNDFHKELKDNSGINLGIKFENHLIDIFGSNIKKRMKRIYVPSEYKCTDISDVAYKYRDYNITYNLLKQLIYV